MSVCRLCLECYTETSVTVAEDDINKLVKLIPSLNTALKRICLICETCSENIMFAIRFIDTAKETENRIRNEKKKLNLKVIDLRTLRSDTPSFTGEVSVCRICLKFIRYPRIFLDENNTNIMHHGIIRRMLKECFIRLKYEFTEKPVMCMDCWRALQSLYTFKKSYLEVKRKVNLFCRLQNYPLRNINEDTLEIVKDFFDGDLVEPPPRRMKTGLKPYKRWFMRSDDVLLLSLYYEVSDIGQVLPQRCVKEIQQKWSVLRPNKSPPLKRVICKRLKSMLTSNSETSYEVKERIKAEVRSKLILDMVTDNGLAQESDNESVDDRFVDEGVNAAISSANSYQVKLEPSSDVEEEFLNFIEPKLEMQSDCESSNSLPELERMDLPVEPPSLLTEQPSLIPEQPLSTPMFTINQPSYNIDQLSSRTKTSLWLEQAPNITNQAPLRVEQKLFKSNTTLSVTNQAPSRIEPPTKTTKLSVLNQVQFSTEQPPSEVSRIEQSTATRKPEYVNIEQSSSTNSTLSSKKGRISLRTDLQPLNADPLALNLPQQPYTKKNSRKRDWPVFQLEKVQSSRTTRSKSAKKLEKVPIILLQPLFWMKENPSTTGLLPSTVKLLPSTVKLLPSTTTPSPSTLKLLPAMTKPSLSTTKQLKSTTEVLPSTSNNLEPPVLRLESSSPELNQEPPVLRLESSLPELSQERVGKTINNVDDKRDVLATLMKDHNYFTTMENVIERSQPARGISYAEDEGQKRTNGMCHAKGKRTVYQCKKCSYGTNIRFAYSLHMKIKHNLSLPLYECRMCHFSTPDATLLGKHHTQIHLNTKKSYRCTICNYTTSCDKLMEYHNNRLHALNLNHAQQHVDDRISYQCDEYFSGNNMSLIKMHPTREHQDNSCAYSPTNNEEFKQHLQPEHKDVPKHSTKETGSTDDTAGNTTAIKKHTALTHQKVSYQCEKCHYDTNDKFSFDRHAKLHTDCLILFKCEECDYSSNTVTSITEHATEQHQLVVSQLNCSKCDFSAKSNLIFNRHLRLVHNNVVMPYKCEKCGFGTTNKLSLLRHARGHQSFKCKACDYTTTESIEFGVHMATLHDDKRHIPYSQSYECIRCRFRTFSEIGFKRHWRNQHEAIPRNVQPPA